MLLAIEERRWSGAANSIPTPKREHPHLLSALTISRKAGVIRGRGNFIHHRLEARRSDGRASGTFQSPAQARLSFPQPAGEFCDQLPNRSVEIFVPGASVNIAAWQRHARAGRVAGFRSAVTAQNDLGRESVVRETLYRRDLFGDELTQRIAEMKVMSGEVDWQVVHSR